MFFFLVCVLWVLGLSRISRLICREKRQRWTMDEVGVYRHETLCKKSASSKSFYTPSS